MNSASRGYLVKQIADAASISIGAVSNIVNSTYPTSRRATASIDELKFMHCVAAFLRDAGHTAIREDRRSLDVRSRSAPLYRGQGGRVARGLA
jgi:hypothetical protein